MSAQPKATTRRVVLATLVATLLIAVVGLRAAWTSQRGPATSDDLTEHAWTLDEALMRLVLHPRDPYLQYVALQLSRGTPRARQVRRELENMIRRGARFDERNRDVNAFGIFSGALAIQESLQLDRLAGSSSGAVSESRAGRDEIAVSTLPRPTIKSHPWTEMLAGRKPPVSRLARCVPEDFYFIKARSLTRLLELKDLGDLWSRHLVTQSTGAAHSQLFADRLLRQLAVDASDPLRPLYDTAVGEVAVVGSDLFLREGSDVTLLFEVREPTLFEARMSLFLAAAKEAHPGAQSANGEYLGVKYSQLTSADRGVHVFFADAADGLHVRSNSLHALKRVIEAIQGRTSAGQRVVTLGDSEEFAYVRTLMPAAAPEEDVLVYLSDPFIRRLVGPQLKLTELRRMYCYNHLRMLGHARLLFQTQHGRSARTLQELVESGCAPPEFLDGRFECPEGGQYSLSEDGGVPVCSHHGSAESLTPCCELPVTKVTKGEAEAYRTFLTRYNSYWRTFFDPIAVRVQVTPARYRVETIILPLIDNSIYSGLARTLGGPPEALDAGPVPERNIFSAAVRLNKVALAREFGLEPLLTPEQLAHAADEPAGGPPPEALTSGVALREIGLAFHNFHDVYGSFPPVRNRAKPEKTGLSWRVHLLPFLDEGELYREFKLDEPWDSPHNKALIARLPAVFRPADTKLAAAGKTRFVTPVGRAAIYSRVGAPVRIADILDGTANTVMIVEADDEHAVVWTKPDDLAFDPRTPQRGLRQHTPGGFLLLTADGRVAMCRKTVDDATLVALMTRATGEPVELAPHEIALRLPSPGRRSRMPVDDPFEQIGLGQVLIRGIGNQVGVHVYDADPLVGFSIPEFLGESVRSVGLRGGGMDGEFLVIGLLIASISSPVYASIPVDDPAIVDKFLDGLDAILPIYARAQEGFGFMRFNQDFYGWPVDEEHKARAYTFRFGPVTARIFWARIGDHVYITSKPDILRDLLAMGGHEQPSKPDPAATGHAMIRLRPAHWKRVLSHFQLGWAERNRTACLHNLGPLSSLQRAVTGDDAPDPRTIDELAARFYDAHFYCPDGGHYVPTEDGRSMTCAVHGSAARPHQPAAATPQSAFGTLLKELEELTLTLTFLEDGLRAVVTVDRSPAK